ncbi:unnamed protein product [Alternaria alternata]
MSFKEKDLEAERNEHISFDEKGDRGEDGRVNIEDVDQPNDTSGQASSPFEKDDKETRRIIRKIDLDSCQHSLLSMPLHSSTALIFQMYSARIAGMDEDLGLSIGSRYSILTMIFFIPYIIFQFPLCLPAKLLEGAITVLLGFMGFVTIIDFPDKASQPSPITKRPFLTSAEANIILARIQRDRGDAVADKLTWSTISTHLRDWKIWEFAWLYFLNNVVAYSWGYFLPIILRNDMKYSVAMSQILSFPPYVLAAAWMFATAWVADRYRMRDAPKYTPAMAVVIATQVLTIVHVLKNFRVYSRANRQADRGERILEGQEGFRQTL